MNKAIIQVERIRGSKPVRYRVVLAIDHQSFGINSEFQYTKSEAHWLQKQLLTALVRLCNKAIRL